MKKVFAFLFLCFYFNQSYAWGWFDNEPTEQEIEVKKVDNNTKSFIGFSVGAGVGDISNVPAFEPRFFKSINDELLGNSLEFALAIEGGFQRYTHEKVGYQTMFRGRFVYMSDFKNPIISAPIPKNFTQAFSFELSAGIDGIFDFIKNDKSSFGMILGINGGVSVLMPNKDGSYHFILDGANSYGVFSNLRIGFQIGLPTGFIDLVLESSFVPLMLMKSPFNYTLSLGYKHFF